MLWQRVFNVFALLLSWSDTLYQCFVAVFFSQYIIMYRIVAETRDHILCCNRHGKVYNFRVFLSAPSIQPGPVFSYKLRYIVGFWLVETAVLTNQKPTIYRNLYENTGPDVYTTSVYKLHHSVQIDLFKPKSKFNPKIDPGYRYIDTTVELVLV